MATYFHGNTEMQGSGDALQTLILMNPANQQHHLYSGGGVGAPHEVKQGLSLSLSGEEEEVRVFGKAALSCKYLKAAQQLLDEVVNIRKEAKKGRQPDIGKDPEPSAGKRGTELTMAEKQEIQMKKAKLVDMLHEVGNPRSKVINVWD